MLEYLIGGLVGAPIGGLVIAVICGGRGTELARENRVLSADVGDLLDQLSEKIAVIADRDGRIELLTRELANATAPLVSVAKTPAKPAAKRKAAK